MKTFEVNLTKSYLVKIKEKNKEESKELAEFYTGDITDLSSTEEREKECFEIEIIDCMMSEAFEVEEIK